MSSYYLSLTKLWTPSFPAAMPNDNATMTAGSPKIKTKIYIFLTKQWLLEIIYDKWQCFAIFLTPGNRLIYPHFVHDVVDLDNKQVEVDSLDEHPTEGCHQKVLQKGRHGNTGILHNRTTVRVV